MNVTSTDPVRFAQRYLDAWNEHDEHRRAKAVAAVFDADARYVDPMSDCHGHGDIDRLIDGVQQRFAGLRFALHGTPQAHHDVLRFSWSLAAASGAEPVAVGTDVAELDAAGRMRRVTGFIDHTAGA